MVTGRIDDQREGVRRNLVEAIIIEDLSSTEFKPSLIVKKAKDVHGININETEVITALEDIEFISNPDELAGKTYTVEDKRRKTDYEKLLNEAWAEFQELLDARDSEFDKHRIDSDVETVFYKFFEDMFDSISNSNKSIEEISQDPLYEYNTKGVIDELIINNNINNEGIFRNAFQDYLEDPTNTLKQLTECVYIGLINLELLERENELDLSGLGDEEITIFLDTTILVALLCDTDNRNPVATELAELSREKEYNLYYLPRTRSEMQNFIQGSISEMEGYGGRPPNEEVIRSQFVEDWYRQDERNWSGYKADLLNWKDYLELYEIQEYEENLDIDEGVYSMIDSQIRSLDRSRGENKNISRADKNIDHDARLISKAFSIRKDSDKSGGIPTPIVMTLDNLVSEMNEMGKPKFWEDHMIVQPRQWLNYILTFTTVSYEDSDDIDLGGTILNTTVNFDQSIEIKDIDEFVELMAPKAGLEEADDEKIIEYLQTIGFDEEIERSLKRGEGGEAENKFQKATTEEEFLEVFEELSEKDEQLKKASETVNEYQEKYENEREKRKQAEKIISDVSGVDVSINTTAISESVSRSEAVSIANDFDNFVELLDSNLKDGIANSDAPKPPKEVNSAKELRSWLNDVSSWLQASGKISSAAKALAPVAKELASNIPV